MNILKLYSHCTLCPRECGVDRLCGERGACGASATVRAGRAALHFWEEPCISGTDGSGAVFFSGCALGCVYCQNFELSRSALGREVSNERLSGIFSELSAGGAHNINLVTPTHYLPNILHALDMKRPDIPVVWNSSGYEKRETLELLRGYVDIFLPDFKYIDAEGAIRYSAAADYPQRAKEALHAMVEQVGPFVIKDGLMKSGVIVRHLVLPGRTEQSKSAVEYLYREYGDDIMISIMSQYTPMNNVKGFPELERKLTEAEYDEVVDYALSIGVENAYIQQSEAAEESFIPHFGGEGV